MKADQQRRALCSRPLEVLDSTHFDPRPGNVGMTRAHERADRVKSDPMREHIERESCPCARVAAMLSRPRAREPAVLPGPHRHRASDRQTLDAEGPRQEIKNPRRHSNMFGVMPGFL